jgi:hypothetical protein
MATDTTNQKIKKTGVPPVFPKGGIWNMGSLKTGNHIPDSAKPKDFGPTPSFGG